MSEPPVMSYEARPRSNRAATLSLMLGVLLFVPLIGLLAIHFGRRGIRAAREDGAGGEPVARRGILLGRVNLALTLLAAVVGPFIVINEQRRARRLECSTNLRTIGLAILLYSNTNRNAAPPSFDPLPAVIGVPGPLSMFFCPECVRDPAKKRPTHGNVVKSHYVLAPPWHSDVPLTYVGSIPANAVQVYQPIANHDGRGSNMLFADGHVEWIESKRAAAVIAELEAGQNPPPSLK
jgi:prepilin-type processing-associated H-X9-DG protein